MLVAANGGMQHILWGDAEREEPWIYDLQSIRMQVQEYVAALRIGPVN